MTTIRCKLITLLVLISSIHQSLSEEPAKSGLVRRLITNPTTTAPCFNQINCILSPCAITTCPAFPSAVCRENNCGGCSAMFFDVSTGQRLHYEDCHPSNFSLTAVEADTDTAGGNDTDTEYEYPLEVDQYQKTRDNYGVNLNDEMIDIGRDLVNYGDLDINVAMPLPSVVGTSESGATIKTNSNPCILNVNNSCNQTNNGQTQTVIIDQYQEELGDDPVVNKYVVDNIQKTRDNMGLNLNDEMVDIGRDLINYGHLHVNVVPLHYAPSPQVFPGTSIGSTDQDDGVSQPQSSLYLEPCNQDMITCLIPPCTTAACPSNPNAVCHNDYCGGCSAKYIDTVTKKVLTFDECHSIDIGPVGPDGPVNPANPTNPAIPGNPNPATTATSTPYSHIACGSDTQICPDGSIVGRDVTDMCRFKKCPPANLALVQGEKIMIESLEEMEGDDEMDESERFKRKIVIVVVLCTFFLVILPVSYWLYYKRYICRRKRNVEMEVFDDEELVETDCEAQPI